MLLPGSRPREVERHTRVLLETAAHLRASRVIDSVHLGLAAALPAQQRELASRLCQFVGAHELGGPAAPQLPAFDVAICCSGTASLECAAAALPTVIVYNAGLLTTLAVRRLLRTQHVGLPNILLRQRCFPELLGSDVRLDTLARAVTEELPSREALEARLHQLRHEMVPLDVGVSEAEPSCARVASILSQWLH